MKDELRGKSRRSGRGSIKQKGEGDTFHLRETKTGVCVECVRTSLHCCFVSSSMETESSDNEEEEEKKKEESEEEYDDRKEDRV